MIRIFIDGNSFTALASATNYTNISFGDFSNFATTLVPSTDTNRTEMIQSSVFGGGIWNTGCTQIFRSVPNGTYKISFYVWADTTTFNVYDAYVNGVLVEDNITFDNTTQYHWRKYGPYTTTV